MAQALILMVVVILGVGCFTAIRWVHRRERRLVNRASSNAEVSWKNATQVQELISLYLDVILVHGPDSQVAKAFKFGVENSELWKGNDALEIYLKMIGICDEAVKRHKSWKKK